MNIKSIPIFKVTGLIATLTIGIFIGRQSKDSPSKLETSGSSGSVETRTSERPLSNSSINEHQKDSALLLSNSSDDHQSQIRHHLAGILNTSDRLERTRQLLALIDKLGPNDFEDAIHTFREAGWVSYNRQEFNFLLAGWMKQDPLAAIDYLNQHEPDGRARRSAISSWASENPEAAAAAIGNLEDGGKVNDWVVGLINGIARNDPESALLTLQTLPANETRKQAMRNILPEVVSRGPEFANEWIEMVDDPRMQSFAARGLAGPLARRDPEAASEWISKIKTTDARRDASEVVSDVFASRDLEAATKWAESLPQDTMTEAAEGVAKHMTRKNPAEAARWLQKLGNDPDLDGARIQFLREASHRDPQTALEHVSSLSKPAEQERYYRNILRTWSRSNRDAAIDWAIANSESIPVRVYRSVVPKNLQGM